MPTLNVLALSALIWAALVIAKDAVWSVPWPARVKELALWSTIVFRVSITLDDIIDRNDPRFVKNETPPWKFWSQAASSAFLAIGYFGAAAFIGITKTTRDWIWLGLLGTAWLYTALRSLIKRKPTPTYSTLVFSTLHLAVLTVFLYEEIVRRKKETISHWTLAITSAAIAFLLSLNVTVLQLSRPLLTTSPSINPAKADKHHLSGKFTSPEDNVTLWQYMTFFWIQPLIQTGHARRIRPSDVWQVSPYLASRVVVAKYHQIRSESLLVRLVLANGLDCILDGGLQTVTTVLGFAPALFTKQILEALGTNDPTIRFDAMKYAVLALLAGFVSAELDLIHLYHAHRATFRIRTSLIGALHRKALVRKDMKGYVQAEKAKSGDKQPDSEKDDYGAASVGKVVTLMSGDASTLANNLTWWFLLIEIPVQLAVAVFFLFKLLGVSTFVGLTIVIVNIPINNYLTRLNRTTTEAWRKATDKRVDETNTMIRSIRFIKACDWQSRWVQRIQDARNAELKLLTRRRMLGLVLGGLWSFTPGLIVIGSFAAYTKIFKHTLDIPTAFVSISLFAGLSQPLTFLPTVILEITQAMVCVRRLEAFLGESEIGDRGSTFKRKVSPLKDSRTVSIRGDFSWTDTSTDVINAPTKEISMENNETAPFTLSVSQLNFPLGLTIIAGPTASGKSSLLAALLGEMYSENERVELVKDKGNLAYCAQQPWLENATVQDNILYGSSMDDARYNAVIDACCIRSDLAIFQFGDQTQVGERGISLSGGQKARIALAKAVYSPAKVLILDDILSAVDTHTGKALLDNCLLSWLMQNRVIILVTHHVDLCLAAATQVIYLEDGKVMSCEQRTPTMPIKPYIQTNEAVALETSIKDKSASDEEVGEGSIGWAVYKRYLTAVGLGIWVLIAGLISFTRFVDFAQKWVLKKWGEVTAQTAYQLLSQMIPSHFLTMHSPLFQAVGIHYPSADQGPDPWLKAYAGIFAFGVLVELAISAILFLASIRASRKLFAELLHSIVHSSMRFFDGTPVGRILNRFSDDFNRIDGSCAGSFRALLGQGLAILSGAIVTAVIMPPFIILIVFLLFLVYSLSRPYIRTSRSLRREFAEARSPIYSGFGEILHGVTTVRAYGAEVRYDNRNHERVDAFNKLQWAYQMSNRWLMIRFDVLAAVLNFATFVIAIFGGVSQGLAAIAITSSQSLISTCLRLVRMSAMLELDLNSIERVDKYISNPPEAPLVIENKRPPLSWPSTDSGIDVEDLHIRYDDDLPDVLHGVTFSIKPREKVGLIGRTGSGKSTMSLALLRFLEAHQGRIIVDGVDISTIGLSDLRRNITVMSQDAVLFQGTIRQNLDPFDDHDDNELWDVLERCQMASSGSAAQSVQPSRVPSLTNLNSGSASPNPSSDETLVAGSVRRGVKRLDAPVAENGGNFSSGERQLLALARALLRRPKILLMDEASSSMDKETDKQMQFFIRQAFADATIITIAHRLDTVLDYDRILVLEQGRVAEFDTPKALCQSRGHFYKLMRAAADREVLFAALDEELPED